MSIDSVDTPEIEDIMRRHDSPRSGVGLQGAALTPAIVVNVRGEGHRPLPRLVFNSDVTKGLISEIAHRPPRRVHQLSDSEMLVEYDEGMELEGIMNVISQQTTWLGQPALVTVSLATPHQRGLMRREELNRAPSPRPMEPVREGTEPRVEPPGVGTVPALWPNRRLPALKTFSGLATPGKDELTFRQWCFDIAIKRRNYRDQDMAEAMMNSLVGMAKEKLMGLGGNVTVEAILNILGPEFGKVTSYDVLTQELNRIQMGKNERISEFSVRLCSAIERVRRMYPDRVTDANAEVRLRERFFYGLRRSLRDSVRYRYDTGATYPQLLTALREQEAEREGDRAIETATSKAASVEPQTPKVSGTLDKLNETLGAFMNVIEQKKGNGKGKGKPPAKTGGKAQSKGATAASTAQKAPIAKNQCRRCKGIGHWEYQCPSPLNSKGGEQKSSGSPQPEKEKGTQEDPKSPSK